VPGGDWAVSAIKDVTETIWGDDVYLNYFVFPQFIIGFEWFGFEETKIEWTCLEHGELKMYLIQ
jgi:hypothetical protein